MGEDARVEYYNAISVKVEPFTSSGSKVYFRFTVNLWDATFRAMLYVGNWLDANDIEYTALSYTQNSLRICVEDDEAVTLIKLSFITYIENIQDDPPF